MKRDVLIFFIILVVLISSCQSSESNLKSPRRMFEEEPGSFPGSFPPLIYQNWQMYKFNEQRTGYDPDNNKINKNLNLLWSYTDYDFSHGVGPEASPVIFEDIIYLSTIDHSEFGPSLLAFSLSTGDILWHFSFGETPSEGIFSTPYVDKDYVYVGSWNRNFFAIDRIDGSEAWSVEISQSSRGIRASPAVKDNVVYIGTIDNLEGTDTYLYSIDKNTGTILDQFQLPGHGMYSSPTINDNTLFFVSYDWDIRAPKYIYSIDISNPSNLQENWNIILNNVDTRSSIVIYDNYLFYAADKIYVIDPISGIILRGYTLPSPLSGATAGQMTLSIAYGNIYGVTSAYIYSVDLIKLINNDPNPFNWYTDLRPYTNHLYGFEGSSPSIANGLVFIGYGDEIDGRFFAINAYSGNVEWHYDGPDNLGTGYAIATPAISGDKAVFVSAHDRPTSGLHVFKSA